MILPNLSTEFQINEYITVRLERGTTNVYVNGQFVRYCKYLLLNIPKEDIPKYNELKSIDEISEYLDKSLERNEEKFNIDPKVEFWAHCSNLQVWAENHYDFRLLHSNLAFPLLKKLTKAGDPIARRVFKEKLRSD